MQYVIRLYSYLFDLCYGAVKYPRAWFRLKVYFGTFHKTTTGNYQKIFYEELLNFGFKKTFWQLVFPGQTAGLIKRVERKFNGANEYHVRFYEDGTIDCEIEVDRFSELHWSGHREHDHKLLFTIVEKSSLPKEVKNNILSLFDIKKFSDNCIRNKPIHTG